ncbi:MAG: polysaccharide pyruvyl transferase family protein [Armatimonadetes bacterium]|nr:polysaccharide pyruvyl transferase family protein [Armatimonadota bacterium]
MAQILLAGYFGEGNLGDDGMLEATIDELRNRGHGVHVLTGAPEETSRLYHCQGYLRTNMKLVTETIEMCDMLAFPGGSIFQDVSSVRSVAYYMELVRRAKNAKKPVALVGQGVGPLNNFIGKRLAKSAFEMADIIAVRDPKSADTIKELGVTKRVHLTADPAFMLVRYAAAMETEAFELGDMRTVGLAPRPYGKKGEVVNLFGDLAKRLYAARFVPTLIEMDRSEDAPLIEAISKAAGGKVPDLKRLGTAAQVQKRFARMESVIAMRLHAGIFASTVNVPPFLISYDPKVTALGKLLGVGHALSFEGLTSENLFNQFMEWLKDREKHRIVMAKEVTKLAELARQNIDLIEQAVRPRK